MATLANAIRTRAIGKRSSDRSCRRQRAPLSLSKGAVARRIAPTSAGTLALSSRSDIDGPECVECFGAVEVGDVVQLAAEQQSGGVLQPCVWVVGVDGGAVLDQLARVGRTTGRGRGGGPSRAGVAA